MSCEAYPFGSNVVKAVLDPSYGIVSATELPVAEVYAIAREVAWVNGVRVTSAQNLLARPDALDRTAQFAAAMATVEKATASTPITTARQALDR